jgi:hypothetical protein
MPLSSSMQAKITKSSLKQQSKGLWNHWANEGGGWYNTNSSKFSSLELKTMQDILNNGTPMECLVV